MATCPDCGQPTPDSNNYCEQCGAALGETESGDQWAQTTDGRQPSAQGNRSRTAAGGQTGPHGTQSPTAEPVQTQINPDSDSLEYAIKLPYINGYSAIGYGTVLYIAALFLGQLLIQAGLYAVGIDRILYEFAPDSIPIFSPVSVVVSLVDAARAGSPTELVVTLLLVVSVLLAFAPVAGYACELARAAAGGSLRQPPFGNPLQLVRRGVVFIGIYGIIVTILTGIRILLGTPFVGAEFVVYSSAVTPVFAYFVPAPLLVYAVDGFDGILSGRAIGRMYVSWAYLKNFIIYTVLTFCSMMLLVLLAFLLFITVIGMFLALPLGFVFVTYFVYGSGSFWGTVYYRLVQNGSLERSEPSAEW